MSRPEAVLDRLRRDPVFRDQITFWHTIPEQAAVYDDLPDGFSPAIRELLRKK